MAAIKKPRLRKLPKRPKVSASLEAWENWEKKAKEIQKENRKKVSAYDSKVKAKKSIIEKKKRISKIGKV